MQLLSVWEKEALTGGGVGGGGGAEGGWGLLGGGGGGWVLQSNVGCGAKAVMSWESQLWVV